MVKFVIEVVIDPKRAVTGTQKVRKALERTETAGNKLRKTLQRAFAGAAIFAGVTAATRTLADFSQEMSTVAAVTQATRQEFEELEARAKSLGLNTRFSATQAAEGMTFLARAGFDANEVMEAIEGSLNLAQAGALSVADAADIASNALQGFRLETSETQRVVDVLALAANTSNTTVRQLGDGLKFVAPIAAGLGVEIEETTGAIAALSNAGLQATLAGTGLRRVLSELESPSAKTRASLSKLGLETEDFQVSSVGLTGALQALADAGVDTGLALEIFGDRGGPAFEVLSSSISDVRQFTEALKLADGTAQRIADTMDDNLNGAILAAKSALEGFVISVGDAGATGALRGFFEVITTGTRTASANVELLAGGLLALGTAFAAVRFAPIGADVLAAAAAFVKLRLAVSAGTAVVLGSAAATQLQAIAEVEATAATLAKTGADLAAAQAGTVRTVIFAGITELEHLATIAELEHTAAIGANTVAANANATAQARLATAMKATTIQARILSVINPFAAVIAGITLAGVGINKILSDFEKLEAQMLAVNEQGEKFQLTEFGKVGADIIRVQENLARVNEQIDIDVTTKGFANPTALALAKRYEDQLKRLGVQQGFLADGTSKTVDETLAQVMATDLLANAVDSTVTSIERQNELLRLNSREREVQLGLLEEVNRLEQESGLTVTDEQKDAITVALERNQTLSDQAAAFDAIRGPQAEFEAAVAALTALEEEGRITTEEFNEAILALGRSAEGVDLSGISPGGGDDLVSRIKAQLDATKELARAESERSRALADIEGPLAGLQARQEAINSLLADGTISQDQATAALMRNQEAIALLNPEYALQQELLESIKGPQEELLATQAALNVLLAEGSINAEEYSLALERMGIKSEEVGNSIGVGLVRGLENAKKAMFDVEGAAQTLVENGFRAAEDALVDFIQTGDADFSAFIDGLLADLARLLAKQALLAAFGGGGGGGGFFGALFGGARADGGDVNPNQAFLVGEEGAEIFTPDQAGTITPAGETAAILGQQQQQPVNVNVAPAAVSITNVSDPNDIPTGIESPEGEQSVMNVIRRNARTVRELV